MQNTATSGTIFGRYMKYMKYMPFMTLPVVAFFPAVIIEALFRA